MGVWGGGVDEIKRKWSSYASQFRRAVLHGVAAPRRLLLHVESVLSWRGAGGSCGFFQRRVGLRVSGKIPSSSVLCSSSILPNSGDRDGGRNRAV